MRGKKRLKESLRKSLSRHQRANGSRRSQATIRPCYEMNRKKSVSSKQTANDCWYLGIWLAIAIECVTCFFRFGLNLQSTRDTSWLRGLTFGLRSHHGYIGMLLLAAAFLFAQENGLVRKLLIIVGIGLLLSDLIHHFLILWPICGSPSLDLVYPKEM